MPAKLVTLASFSGLQEAQSAAQILKDSGIPAFIQGEATAMLTSNDSKAAITIEVAEEDLEFAQRVLFIQPGSEKIPTLRPAVFDSASPAGSRNRVETVEVFYDPLDAEHAANCLKRHSIPYRLHGVTHGILPGLAPNIPMLRLDVLEEDLEEACARLGFTVEEPEPEEVSPERQGQFTANRAAVTPSIPVTTRSSNIERHADQPQIAAAGSPAVRTDKPPAPEQERGALKSVAEFDAEGTEPHLDWSPLVLTLAIVALMVIVLVLLLRN